MWRNLGQQIFYKKGQKEDLVKSPLIGLPRQAHSRQIARSHVSLPYLNFIKEMTLAGTYMLMNLMPDSTAMT
jgi:hypothetical protein